MTTSEAIEVLRIVPAGVGTARQKAIAVAIEALLAKPLKSERKTATKPKAAPKVSRHTAHLLKQRFVVGVTLPGTDADQGRRSAYFDLMGKPAPELEGATAQQFAYGMRAGAHKHSKDQDAAILYAAAS